MAVVRANKKNKMKTAILATLIASAAAFAPSKNAAPSTVATKMAFEEELGAQPPIGFWDPLGIVAGGDEKKFDRLRYVEIKHGRISMLAVVGYLVTYAGVRFGGTIDAAGTKFADIPSGFNALDSISDSGICQIVGFVGWLELFVMKDVTGDNEFVGDFRNGAVGSTWDNFDDDTKLKKRAIELNQGRAAMMGILGLMVHEMLGVSILPAAP